MEDGATEAESILHPMQENYGKEDDEVKEDGDDRGAGRIDHILSNLVTKREVDEDKEEEELKRDERAGGILDHIISTLVSPKAGGVDKDKDPSFFQFRNGGGNESEDHEKGRQEDTVKVDGDNEETEGGGSIIDNIVSQFPTSLPGIFLLPLTSVFKTLITL